MQCFETYSTEDIVQKILDENNPVAEDAEDEISNLEVVDSNVAKESLKKLLCYFQANKKDCSHYVESLMKMENFLADEKYNNCKQDV